MQDKGIRFHLQDNIDYIEKTDAGLTCTLSSGETLLADEVLYAVGRNGYVDSLGLEPLGIKVSKQGVIEVDDRFQSRVDSIFALGDVIGTPALTPVALAQAMVFVNQQFGDNSQTMSYTAIPTAVFTQPNIATVGLTEQQALVEGFKIAVYMSDFKHLKHTLTQSKERVLMKLIVEQGSETILGIHMIGPDAGEIIQGFSLAVKCGLTKADLDSVIGIHPTAAEEFVTMRQVSYLKP
jgi:glutathione reductase (NADPH)